MIPTLEDIKKLDGKNFAMLTSAEHYVLTFYRERGRKFDVSIAILSDADPIVLSYASRQQADEILKRSNSKIQVTFGKNANEFYAQQTANDHSRIIIGSSGTCKSVLIQEEADRLGITYEDFLKRIELTHEQKDEQRIQDEEDNKVEIQRLNAVREAFWRNTPEDHYDLDLLHDALADILEEPTQEQIKTFFMMIPPEIFGSAISWGFDDTEVREQLFEFAEENAQSILEKTMAIKLRNKHIPTND